MARVRIGAISKSFSSVVALKNVSLDVTDGEFLTLVGPSGCGKSTLLRIIAGLERADAGAISIGDARVDAVAPSKRNVAMVFQSYALYPHMTVAENLALPLRMRRLNAWQRLPLLGKLAPGSRDSHAAIDREVLKVSEMLGLSDLVRRKPAQLSGGQRQRVAIGRALVRDPSVFLMDEPLSNLDPKLRIQTRAEIVQLQRRLRATFIYVTHDQAEAMTMSDRVAVMMAGEILQVAAPQDLYDDPDDLRVAEFLGSPKLNCLPGQMGHNGIIEVPGGTISNFGHSMPGSAFTVGIHPESLLIAQPHEFSDLIGTVQLIEHLGPDLFVHVNIGDAFEPLVVRSAPSFASELRMGAKVQLRVQQAMVFDSVGHRIRTQRAALPKSSAPVAAHRCGARL